MKRELDLYCESRGLTYEIDYQFGLIYFNKKPYTGTDMGRILEECFNYENNPRKWTFTLSLLSRLTASQIIQMLEDIIDEQ